MINIPVDQEESPKELDQTKEYKEYVGTYRS